MPKFLVFLIFVAILAPLSLPFLDSGKMETKPQIAAATWPTWDFPSLAGFSLEYWKEFVGQFIANRLKKRMLDMIVDQIIVWINGGGKPQFVSDWNGFLQDAFSDAVGEMIADKLGGADLCAPFSVQMRMAFYPVPKFSKQVKCSLNKIVKNINSFYFDFKKGGWPAYRASWEPKNNFYGLYLVSNDELVNAALQKTNAAASEAEAASGFLSTKKCVQYDVQNSKRCLKWETTTPGTVIGNQVSKAIGSDIDFIVNSEDLSAYVGAIVDAAVNRLIKSGAKGLAGMKSSDEADAESEERRQKCKEYTGSQKYDCLCADWPDEKKGDCVKHFENQQEGKEIRAEDTSTGKESCFATEDECKKFEEENKNKGEVINNGCHEKKTGTKMETTTDSDGTVTQQEVDDIKWCISVMKIETKTTFPAGWAGGAGGSGGCHAGGVWCFDDEAKCLNDQQNANPQYEIGISCNNDDAAREKQTAQYGDNNQCGAGSWWFTYTNC